MEKKTLGILGGVGPLATMYIGEMIVRHTAADRDQDHVDMVITNNTTIPDRTAFIIDSQETDPVPFIVRDTERLARAGADLIAIPCNTAHSFYPEIAAASPVRVLNMIEETVNRAAEEGAETLGILATDGTIISRVYQNECESKGIMPVLPDVDVQETVMEIIYDYVKAGRPTNPNLWFKVEESMKEKGCEKIVLGCTELSIVKKELSLNELYIDSLLVLAEKAILECGHSLRIYR